MLKLTCFSVFLFNLLSSMKLLKMSQKFDYSSINILLGGGDIQSIKYIKFVTGVLKYRTSKEIILFMKKSLRQFKCVLTPLV